MTLDLSLLCLSTGSLDRFGLRQCVLRGNWRSGASTGGTKESSVILVHSRGCASFDSEPCPASGAEHNLVGPLRYPPFVTKVRAGDMSSDVVKVLIVRVIRGILLAWAFLGCSGGGSLGLGSRR